MLTRSISRTVLGMLSLPILNFLIKFIAADTGYQINFFLFLHEKSSKVV